MITCPRQRGKLNSKQITQVKKVHMRRHVSATTKSRSPVNTHVRVECTRNRNLKSACAWAEQYMGHA